MELYGKSRSMPHTKGWVCAVYLENGQFHVPCELKFSSDNSINNLSSCIHSKTFLFQLLNNLAVWFYLQDDPHLHQLML